MRKLASIQTISKIEPIEGADAIEVATVLGWQVVVKKGEFKEGDLCVYCEIDSVLPATPEFDFLARSKYRIKTIRLRGQISQGICFPLSVLEHNQYTIGDDVTALLGVYKYEPRPEDRLCRGASALTKGGFPGYVHKTDEIRIQSCPELLEELKGTVCFATVKVDGASATFSRLRDEVDVCSRSRSLKPFIHDELSGVGTYNIYWTMYLHYGIHLILDQVDGIAIQGEIAGYWDCRCHSRIQQNRLGLSKPDLFVFNVFDIKANRYYNFSEFNEFCRKWNLNTVPLAKEPFVLNHTIPQLLEMAKGTYNNGSPREGIVIRPVIEKYSSVLKGRASFKVINNDFLLKNGE